MSDFVSDILLFFSIFVIFCVCLNYYLRSAGYMGPLSDHFDGERFHNVKIGAVNPKHRRHFDKTSAFTLFIYFIFKHFDDIRWRYRPLLNGQTTPLSVVPGSEIVVTFINHSTVLLQTEGLNILTDPIWARRASPSRVIGPKRYMDPGVALQALPHIDIVLLSHNHYDHMDIPTLKKISKRDNPVIYTTLGNTKYLRSKGIFGGIDMDWGESRTFSDTITVECTPAQHFSSRAISDRKKTLWGGFVIKTPHGNIYFVGDTAYGPFVSHVQRAYPEGFRFALIPIGAYSPEKFFKKSHMGPDDALLFYTDLGVREAVAIHWGTFDLAFDGQDDPRDHLHRLLAQPEHSHIRFHTLANGETRIIE